MKETKIPTVDQFCRAKSQEMARRSIAANFIIKYRDGLLTVEELGTILIGIAKANPNREV